MEQAEMKEKLKKSVSDKREHFLTSRIQQEFRQRGKHLDCTSSKLLRTILEMDEKRT